jgi:hypothetical protein
LGLRRADLHFVVDTSSLGCEFPGSHLHVVHRDNSSAGYFDLPMPKTPSLSQLMEPPDTPGGFTPTLMLNFGSRLRSPSSRSPSDLALSSRT